MRSPPRAASSPRGHDGFVVPLQTPVGEGVGDERSVDDHDVLPDALAVQLVGDPARPSGVVLHRRHPETARRTALGEQAGEEDGAESAAELDNTAPAIDDDVVADGHQAGRPHRAGAPREVRPRQCREGDMGGFVPERSGGCTRRRSRLRG